MTFAEECKAVIAKLRLHAGEPVSLPPPPYVVKVHPWDVERIALLRGMGVKG